jgi:Cu(I)/Ag(I) efflux system periplasmic protein CusF
MKRISMMIFVVGAFAVPAAYAQSVQGTQLAQAAAGKSAPTMAEAEVRKVDKGAGKITLKHGEIKNLDMPAMTMVFQVKDKAMLDKVKAGDKVRFAADNVGGAITITQIEPTK